MPESVSGTGATRTNAHRPFQRVRVIWDDASMHAPGRVAATPHQESLRSGSTGLEFGALTAACRIALSSETGTVDGPMDWSGTDAQGFLRWTARHRVAPLLAAHLDSLEAPESIASGLRKRAVHATAQGLQLTFETSRAMRALSEADVRAAAFKGVVASVQTTGIPAARGSGDIDILVRPEDLPRAHAALLSAGWQGDSTPEEPRWRRRYMRLRRERSYQGRDSKIDLHWRINWIGDRPLPGPEVLLGRAESVDVAGTSVAGPSPSDSFAIACYSAYFDRFPRLRELVDIVRFTRQATVDLPADADRRLRLVVAASVALAADVIGGVPADRLSQFTARESVDLGSLRRLWSDSSHRPYWFEGERTLGELARVYWSLRHAVGLRGPAELLIRDSVLPPERLIPGLGPLGRARVVGNEVNDLLRRRILRRPARSRAC